MATCESCGATGEGRFCKFCGTTLSDASPAAGLLRRADDDEDALTCVVAEPIASGTQVTVGASEVFVALAQGAVLAVLVTGRHALPRALDAGVFVSTRARSLRVRRALPSISGHGLRAMGTIELSVVEPATLIGATRDLHVLEGEAFDTLVASSAGELIERAVHAAVERGVAIDDLPAALPAILLEANALWPIPGTRVDLSAVEVSLGPLGAAGDEEEDDDEEDEDEDEDGDEEEGDEEGEADLTDLIGEEVSVLRPGGRRVRGTVEGIGYLVRFENGETTWVPIDAIEID